jgi:hypothetical protein
MDLIKLCYLLFSIIFCLTFSRCRNSYNNEKNPILLADREAPAGWIYLRIFEDSTFEFESRGLERKGTIYPGTINLKNDTLFFNYKDSIPNAGRTAILTSNSVAYIEGKYPERVEVKLNKLKK